MTPIVNWSDPCRRCGQRPAHTHLGINPGPLRRTPPRVTEDRDAGRCKATTRKGLRCIRDAVDGNYCRQHAPVSPRINDLIRKFPRSEKAFSTKEGTK